MRKRRGSPDEPMAESRSTPAGHPASGYGLNVLWLNALAGWASDSSASEWTGPKPEMIAAALVLAEIAADRVKKRVPGH